MPAATKALITGITGQDGSFLAELLLDKGYEVSGLLARAGARTLGSSEHLRGRIELIEGDLLDPGSLSAAIEAVRPVELYHLAAPSFVPASWEQPGSRRCARSSAPAPTLLEAVRDDRSGDTRVRLGLGRDVRRGAARARRREDTPARPSTPYAVAKLAAHQLVGAMREHDGLHASSGIVFNHESERRPEQFVTRRVTRAAAAISLGLQRSSRSARFRPCATGPSRATSCAVPG